MATEHPIHTRQGHKMCGKCLTLMLPGPSSAARPLWICANDRCPQHNRLFN